MTSYLDILVPLANIGASGICIFGVFMTGLLIREAAKSPDPALLNSIHLYMVMCTTMAVISAVTGVYNAAYNQARVVNSEQKASQLQASVSEKTNALVAASKTIYDLSRNQVSLATLKDQLSSVTKQLTETKAVLEELPKLDALKIQKIISPQEISPDSQNIYPSAPAAAPAAQ